MNRLKIRIKLLLRFKNDVLSGRVFRYARKKSVSTHFDFSVFLQQEIKPSETFENKRFNLQKAANQLNNLIIQPKQCVSFWKIVGSPKKGYKTSRSLVKGEISEEIGGGLCQVSGILYHLALLSGWKIIERHNHSIDIYTEDNRFTPLGTDATVVYGSKDLIIQNPFNFPIKIQFEVLEKEIKTSFSSSKELILNELIFKKKEYENTVSMKIFNHKQQLLNSSTYKKMV